MSVLDGLEIFNAGSLSDVGGSNFPRLRLPFISDFVQSLAGFRALKEGNCIRSYQVELIRSGTFSVTSPFTGKTVSIVNSVVLHNQMFFYRLADVEPIYVIASALGAGYPITGVFFPVR